MVLEAVRPRILATQFIPNVPPDLARAYSFSPEHTAAALVTADQDDALYVALDEATKQAPVEVVFARSLYAGSNHAPGPFSGATKQLTTCRDRSQTHASTSAAA